MKFHKLLVNSLLIFCFFFPFGCGDDDSQEVSENPLFGKWQWTVNERSNCGDPADEGAFSLTDCSDGCFYYEFKENGTVEFVYTEAGVTETATGSYSIIDTSLTVCVESGGTESCKVGELTITGNTFSWFISKEDPTSCDVNRVFEKL